MHRIVSVASWCSLLMAFMGILGCQPAAPPAAGGGTSEATPPAAMTPRPVPPTTAPDAAPAAVSGTANATEPKLPVLSKEELAEGWIALFDGHSLFGWHPSTTANWRVEDGAIQVDSGPPGLLCTTSQFGDYVLKCEFRAPTTTNSGIFLHTPLLPQDPGSDCYELNIAPPDNPFPTASLVKRLKANGTFTSTDWQAYEITVEGGKVKVVLNGQTALEYTDPNPLRRGHIGLQLNQGACAFRQIKLKPLSTTSLFNGRDLTGWKQYPDMPSRFTVTNEGWINVKNGRGQLESEKSYADFVLRFECISHANHLNSGVFFRSIPGEQMNGYECQIHNGIRDGDPTQPLDCGTGGIFRRQNARRVVAKDLEPFHLTLIAERNHMAAWVNGYQVSDWTDERAPHPNPRNGRRDEAGTLMLQGHDPTTDLSFRAIHVAEIPARRP